MRPDVSDDSRITLRISSEGVTAYCNKNAVHDLIEQLKWMYGSDPQNHFECHVLMTFNDHNGDYSTHSNKNVTIIYEDDLERKFVQPSEKHEGFELTFMVVEDSDFDRI